MSSWSDQNLLFLSLPVDKLLAIAAYGEAAGEGAEGMAAVLNVMRNRAANVSQFGDSEIYSLTGSPYHAIILKKAQFSMFNIGNSVRPIAERMANNFDSEVQSNSTLNQAYGIVTMLINGQLADNTGGATYYYNPSLASPSWASSMVLLGQIGNHLFYSPSGVTLASVSPLTSVIPDVSVEYAAAEAPPEYLQAGFDLNSIMWFLIIGAGIGIFIEMIRRK
jgi:hypothetical protein